MHCMSQNIRKHRRKWISAAAEGQESAVHRCIHAIMHLIEDHAKEAGIPVRFAASKLAENDELDPGKIKAETRMKRNFWNISICRWKKNAR